MPALGIGIGLPFGKRIDPVWLRDAKRYRTMIENAGGSISDSDFANKLCPFVQGLYNLTGPDVDFYLTSSDYNIGTGSILLSFKGTLSTLVNGVLWNTDHVVMPHGSSIMHAGVSVALTPITVINVLSSTLESLSTEFQMFRGAFRLMFPWGANQSTVGTYADSITTNRFWIADATGLVSDAWRVTQWTVDEDEVTYHIRRNASQLASGSVSPDPYSDFSGDTTYPISIYNHMPGGTSTRSAKLSFAAYMPYSIDQAAFYSLYKSTIGQGFSLP